MHAFIGHPVCRIHQHSRGVNLHVCRPHTAQQQHVALPVALSSSIHQHGVSRTSSIVASSNSNSSSQSGSSSSQAGSKPSPATAAAASSNLTTDWEARRKQRVVNDLVDVSDPPPPPPPSPPRTPHIPLPPSLTRPLTLCTEAPPLVFCTPPFSWPPPFSLL
jgi:hypothetical protein